MPRVTRKVETYRGLWEPCLKFSESEDVNMIYGGIDVAKHSHEVCLVNDSGDIVLRMHLDNNHKGMNKLLQTLERLGSLMT